MKQQVYENVEEEWVSQGAAQAQCRASGPLAGTLPVLSDVGRDFPELLPGGHKRREKTGGW